MLAEPTAFALLPEYHSDVTDHDNFDGGSFALPDGRTYDVKKALDEGDGVIVSEDVAEIEGLRAFLAVREVPVPEDYVPKNVGAAAAARVELADRKVSELRALAQERGQDVPKGATKDDLIELLVTPDEGAANEPPSDANPIAPPRPDQSPEA